MKYPFIEKSRKKPCLKLNKKLYSKDLINAINEEFNCVLSVRSKGNYYLVEIDADDTRDYFGFLNYLIYLNRNR